MKNTIPTDLSEIEKRVWKSTLEDGLLDIFFGFLVVSAGLGMTLDENLPETTVSIISISLMVIGFILLLLGKKYISEPRLGLIKLGPTQMKRKLKTAISLLISLIMLSILYLLRLMIPVFIFPEYLDSLIIGSLFITLPLCFAAYFLQYLRLYFIAILVGLSFFLSDIFSIFVQKPLDTIISFGIISAIIISMGSISLYKFMRRYPLSKLN